MMIRISFLLVAIFLCGCQSTQEVDIKSITPLAFVASVSQRAQDMDSTCRLYLIASGNDLVNGEIDTNGYLVKDSFGPIGWSFTYLRRESDVRYYKTFVVTTSGNISESDYDLPVFDSLLLARADADSVFVPESGWMDPSAAIPVAMNSGGREFIGSSSQTLIFAKLSRHYSPQWNTLAWTFTFSRLPDSSVTISVDAVTGQILD